MRAAADIAADAALAAARELLAAIKAGTNSITIADAARLVATIRATEGWLQSCRDVLDPARGAEVRLG